MASLRTAPDGHETTNANAAFDPLRSRLHNPTMRRMARKRAVSIVIEPGVNVVVPLLVYNRVAPYSGDAIGLLASSAPPLLWSLVQFIRRRRVDALSMMVLAGIVLSLLAMLGGGSVRFLQLRENLVTALIGLMFLGSAAIGRPLIYQLARAGTARRSPTELASFDAKRESLRFRRVMMVMTLTWGAGLLTSSALACLLVFALSIQDYLIVSPVIGYGTMAIVGLRTIRYKRSAQRQAVHSSRKRQFFPIERRHDLEVGETTGIFGPGG